MQSDTHSKDAVESKNISSSDSDAQMRSHIIELEAQYHSLKEHTAQLAELGNTTAGMMKQDSLPELLNFISNEIVRLTIANGAYLHMVHETGDYLLVVAARGDLDAQLLGNRRVKGIGLSAEAWEMRTFRYTDNYNQLDSRVVEFPEELKAVAIPLQFSGEISGVAFVTSPIDEDLYSQIPLLQEIAKVASLVIYYKQQLETQASELKRIQALNGLGDSLYQSLGHEEMLDRFCEHLFDIFDVDVLSVYRESLEMDGLVSHRSLEKIEGKVTHAESKPNVLARGGINYWCYENAKFAQIDRHVDDPRESNEVHQYRLHKKLGSTMCIPISHADKPWGVVLLARRIDKRNFDEYDANALNAVASQFSTAIQRNEALAKIKHQAHHDSLTDLPNRGSFENAFMQICSESDKPEFALLFCDLDGFKAVNDAHGHDIGDKVVAICSARMKSCIRTCDILARMGGDEFAVLVSTVEGATNIDALAARITETVNQPINVEDIRIHLGVSIGVSSYPADGTTFSELLNNADVAMYQAKHAGGGKTLHFNKKDAEEIRSKNELRADLQGALERNEFELMFQPQVSWAESKVVGVEALVRWNHPRRGLVPPFLFIPIAEQSGLIDALGLWIMDEAIRYLKVLEGQVNCDFSMGVNISPRQFIDPEFSANVLSIVKAHGIRPDQLKIEITESFIMNERESVVNHLKSMRDAGIVVAIDDFGTGYSSLSYLQDLPIDVLKIDRSFVSCLTDENYKTSIAASIIALANSSGLATITEGVETKAQLHYFKQLGSEVIQGYFYSKPVSASDLVGVIEHIEHGQASMQDAA